MVVVGAVLEVKRCEVVEDVGTEAMLFDDTNEVVEAVMEDDEEEGIK